MLHPGARFQYKGRFSKYEISVLKIRRSRDRLICNMGIHILVRRHLYTGTTPWSCASPQAKVNCYKYEFFSCLDKRLNTTSME